MDPKNWQKVKDVLDEVLQIGPEGRRQFLDAADLDREVRDEVQSLLSFEEASADLMQLSAVEFSSEFVNGRDADDGLAGQQIGSYRIVSEVGHGGMGAVYLAERVDGKFTQRVALKLLKREMNTSTLRRRFEQERDILSRLEHPNIARLLDAGATDDKIPFIAMEYVDGRPIDEYCNKHRLDLKERLDLFRQICSTVDFAHRNLIVHRDLKPSNILVTEDGTPKLLDFGISKIISEDLADQTSTVTKLGAMTPGYASPEQLQNKSVTTSTDIYSLGVILYELLSGHRPFESKEGNVNEIYQAVIDTDPPLPSALAETGSRTDGGPRERTEVTRNLDGHLPASTRPASPRHTSPQVVSIKPQYLRGDLDNIILKALKKEPERRYLSAQSLADDIKRHQDGLPVTARPDTLYYRADKFIRRNSFAVAAAVLIVLAVIGGIIATLWQARVAQAERAKAERRFSDVRKLANSYLFDVYPIVENLEGSLKAREVILTNALQYLDSLAGETGDDRELQGELATAYEKIGDVLGALNNSSLGNIKAGLESYFKARTLREAVYAANPNDLEAKEKLANNYYVIGRTLWNDNQTANAEESFEKGLKLRRELVAAQPDSAVMKNRLAVLLLDYGAIPAFNFQAERALVLFNEALGTINSLRQSDPENADFKKSFTRGIRVLSKAKTAVGDYDGAMADLRNAITISNELAKQFPDDFRVQRSVWLTESILCETYIDRGTAEGAVEACIKTTAFPAQAHEKEPENGVVTYDLAISHFNLSRAYRISGDPKNTITSANRAIEVMSELSKKTPDDMEYRRNLAVYETELGRAYLSLARYDDALAVLHNVIAALVPIVEKDPATTTYYYDIGVAHRLAAEAAYKKGDRGAAVENVDRAIQINRELAAKNSLRESDKGLVAELEKEKSLYQQ
jgi:non-specific serine/threonine protein kinase/serine/threonine-protein kinase